MKTTLNPYLNFNGNCREAMEFYHSIFGGELSMQTFEESGMTVSEEYKNKIVHAALDSEGITLMASEGQPDHPVKFGDNVSLSLVGSEEEVLRGYFEKLSEGGIVTMKLEKQFWGDIFGMLKDKFGFYWMVNIAAKKD